jgi:hypothetical protein
MFTFDHREHIHIYMGIKHKIYEHVYIQFLLSQHTQSNKKYRCLNIVSEHYFFPMAQVARVAACLVGKASFATCNYFQAPLYFHGLAKMYMADVAYPH